MKGIYIIANDKVIENSIALLNSIRFYDPHVPVILIPYDDNYGKVADILFQKFQVKLYPNLDFIDTLSRNLHSIFGKDFFARPNQFRKQACWFGEFDEFLYIDTDIIVFEKIIDSLNYLSEYDFICCDYQGKKGISNVFSPEILNKNIFNEQELKDIFNCGFWGSKKNLISQETLYKRFRECSQNLDYFDFTQKTSDQPIINYLILKEIPKRLNLTKVSDHEPGNWAGSAHFRQRDYILYDNDIPLKYIHWAGIPMKSGGAYRELWEHYRYLGEEKPVFAEKSQNNIWQTMKNRARKILKK